MDETSKKGPFGLRVECYAGHKADERPMRFYLGDRAYQVKEVVDRWYTPEGTYFKVNADDGNVYILCHRQKGQEELWTLESFRKGEGSPGFPIE
jgi:hypothetical protein